MMSIKATFSLTWILLSSRYCQIIEENKQRSFYIPASHDMDVLLTSDKAVSKEQHDQDESGGKCHTANEGGETLATVVAGTDEVEEVDEEKSADKVKPDQTSSEGNDLCSICGFLAKCPRALKIHSTRKHGKRARRRTKSDQAAVPQESAPEDENSKESDQTQESDPNSADEIKSVAKDHGIYARGSVKTEKLVAVEPATEDAESLTKERRLSKRTPKPKVIHSCNYCGQEFWDKSLLEVHVKRTHAKDTPYTCKYTWVTVTQHNLVRHTVFSKLNDKKKMPIKQIE